MTDKDREKVLAAMRACLDLGDDILAVSPILSGNILPGVIVLTEARLIFGDRGRTRFSEPRINFIDLEDVLTASFEAGGLMESMRGQLVVEARSGTFRFIFPSRASKSASEWPHRILTQQKKLREEIGSANSQPGLADQLSQLEELHRSGALSDAEFRTAKARIIEAG